MRSDLHNDEDSDKDRCEASPGNPRKLLKLAYACAQCDHDGRDDGEVIGAKRVVGECIERRGNAHHPRCTNDDKGEKEQDAGYLLDNFSTNKLAHVGDTVTSRMPCCELSLDKRAPGVEKLPSEDVDGAWKGTESVHG